MAKPWFSQAISKPATWKRFGSAIEPSLGGATGSRAVAEPSRATATLIWPWCVSLNVPVIVNSGKWSYLSTQVVTVHCVHKNLCNIFPRVASLNGLKSELFAFHLPFSGSIGRSIYIVPCDREIWVPRIRCPCVKCERDLAGNILNHNVNKE